MIIITSTIRKRLHAPAEPNFFDLIEWMDGNGILGTYRNAIVRTLGMITRLPSQLDKPEIG